MTHDKSDNVLPLCESHTQDSPPPKSPTGLNSSQPEKGPDFRGATGNDKKQNEQKSPSIENRVDGQSPNNMNSSENSSEYTDAAGQQPSVKNLGVAGGKIRVPDITNESEIFSSEVPDDSVGLQNTSDPPSPCSINQESEESETLLNLQNNKPEGHAQDNSLFVSEDPPNQTGPDSVEVTINEDRKNTKKHLLSEDESDSKNLSNLKKKRKSKSGDDEVDEGDLVQSMDSDLHQSSEGIESTSSGKNEEIPDNEVMKKSSKTKKILKKRSPSSKSKAPQTKRWISKSSNFLEIGGQLLEDIFDQNVASGENPNTAVEVSKKKRDFVKSLLSHVVSDDISKAKKDANLILRATKRLARHRVRSTGNGLWRVSGMKTDLPNYQILGAEWMRDREQDGGEPLGGILADMMGLGKTMQTLTLMVCNPPQESDPKPTLIVANKNLLYQWEREIKQHTKWEKMFPKIVTYSSASSLTREELQTSNIILTTYNEIMMSFPKVKKFKQLEDTEESWNISEHMSRWKREIEERRGVLQKIKFYRIVLDEAQAIKNHRSRTSIGCRALQAKYRWALSGTPVENDLTEFYPYFKYLRIPCVGNFKDFEQNFCIISEKVCCDRLQRLLKGFMLRRVHTDKIYNQPILQLPEKVQQTIMIDFKPAEKAIYGFVNNQYLEKIHVFIKSGLVKKKQKQIHEMLLRLRQMTAHVLISHEVIQSLFQLEDLNSIENMTKSLARVTPQQKDIFAQARVMVQDHQKRMSGMLTDPEDNDLNPPLLAENEFKYLKLLQDLEKNGNTLERDMRKLCQECRSPPEKPMLSPCLHLFCADCLESLEEDAAEKELNGVTCPACKSSFGKTNEFKNISVLRSPNWATLDKVMSRTIKKNTMKWIDRGGRKLLSTKMQAVADQTHEWLRADPSCKIIIYTLFTPVIKILGRICDNHRWGNLKYYGEMSVKQREEAIKRFKDDPEKRILLASLKCGSVGLNLTMATRVICVDLWWNNCAEQQAFARIWRKGQTKKTFVTRFAIRNSVDEKIISMQERKANAIRTGMGNQKMMDNLTVEEILELLAQKGEENPAQGLILPSAEDDADEGGIFESSRPSEDEL